MRVMVMDEDLISDDTVGRADISLADLCKTHTEQRFQVVDKDNFKKLNGEIVLQCVAYTGTVLPNQPPKAAPPAAAPAAAPQVVYVQAPAAAPRVVYVQQPAQPQVVYVQQPGPQYIQQPGPQVVYMQPRQV